MAVVVVTRTHVGIQKPVHSIGNWLGVGLRDLFLEHITPLGLTFAEGLFDPGLYEMIHPDQDDLMQTAVMARMKECVTGHSWFVIPPSKNDGGPRRAWVISSHSAGDCRNVCEDLTWRRRRVILGESSVYVWCNDDSERDTLLGALIANPSMSTQAIDWIATSTRVGSSNLFMWKTWEEVDAMTAQFAYVKGEEER